MTSDAKVGLLLGLVLIFVIAFIINGLPHFQKNVNTNELTTSMANAHNNPAGIAANERKLQEVFEQIEAIQNKIPKEKTTASVENELRKVMSLPETTTLKSATKETVELKTISEAAAEPVIMKETIAEKVRPLPPKVIVHIVREGDSLATIAQKFYGELEGNKKTNIARIFEANRSILKSPDEIYTGQKLIVPPLSAQGPDKEKVNEVLSAKIFEKVESIGKRYLAASSRKTNQSGLYVVREGDSLWRIADEQLGDGSRYEEIAGLNADILNDEDSLTVGMRLKIPAR